MAGFEGADVKRNYVVDYIVSAIRSGELTKGESLTERALAAKLNVSRTPVREAFRCMEELGLLQTAPHRGTHVAAYSSEKISHLYDVREMLEGLAARSAALFHTAEEADEMKHLLEQSDHFYQNGQIDELAAINIRFHSLLAQMSHNDYLILQLQQLRDNISLLFAESLRMKERPQRTLAEHRMILESILSHSSELAENTARLHIRNAFENIQAKLTLMEKESRANAEKEEN